MCAIRSASLLLAGPAGLCPGIKIYARQHQPNCMDEKKPASRMAMQAERRHRDRAPGFHHRGDEAQAVLGVERVDNLLVPRQRLCGRGCKGAAPRARYRSNSRAIARIRAAGEATPQTARKDTVPKGWSEIGRFLHAASCLHPGASGEPSLRTHPDCAPTRLRRDRQHVLKPGADPHSSRPARWSLPRSERCSPVRLPAPWY